MRASDFCRPHYGAQCDVRQAQLTPASPRDHDEKVRGTREEREREARRAEREQEGEQDEGEGDAKARGKKEKEKH